MKSTLNRILFSTVLCCAIPFQLLAFSEDLCVGQINPIGSPIGNCLSAEFCSPESDADTRLCRANVMIDAGLVTLASTGTARSMLHTDATYFVAQAIGFDDRAAYWLAAYDQVMDVESYVPFGMRGQQIRALPNGMPTVPITLNGWARSNPDTGGFSYHFVMPYRFENEELPVDCSQDPEPGTVCGIWPDLTDTVHEGFLVHMKEWALGERRPCTNGFTTIDDNDAYFFGQDCYMQDDLILTEPESVPKHITGMMPLLTRISDRPVPFSAYSGDQIAHYLPGSKTYPYPTEIRYASDDVLKIMLHEAYAPLDLDSVLAGRTEDDFVALIRMGLYMHSVQDRISHHFCSDPSAAIGPDEQDNFVILYDETECTQDMHAWGHFQEVGTDPVPPRTTSAIDYTFDELIDFANAYPQWLKADANIDRMGPIAFELYREDIVDDLSYVLSWEEGCWRLRAMLELVHYYGFAQMPGNNYDDILGMCLAPEPPEEEMGE